MGETNGNLALMPKAQMQPSAEWDTAEKLALLRDTYAKGLTQPEFELFIEHCRQIGLNPLTKQVQPVKFDGKTLSFHTTIHGLVAIADRTGRYAGVDDIEYDCEPRGETLGNQHPNWAKATVYKITGGVRCSYTAKVRWLERNRGQASWKVQPWHMLGKCALAAAFRLAFEETKGLYIEEELPPVQIVESTVQPQRQQQSAPAKASNPDERQPGESWRDWTKRLGKRLGIFDTLGDYYKVMQQVTGHPDPKGVINDDKIWQTWEAWLLREIDLAEGLKEEDEGLAKMAGLDDVGSGKTVEAD